MCAFIPCSSIFSILAFFRFLRSCHVLVQSFFVHIVQATIRNGADSKDAIYNCSRPGFDRITVAYETIRQAFSSTATTRLRKGSIMSTERSDGNLTLKVG